MSKPSGCLQLQEEILPESLRPMRFFLVEVATAHFVSFGGDCDGRNFADKLDHWTTQLRYRMDFDLQKLYERRNEVHSIVWICTLSYNSGIFSLYPIF